jgi:uncharacterized protein (DUF1015 family)
MAIVRPFRGIRYNPDKTGDLSQVITQPYDRIGKTQQATYYQQHPNNFVRIDFGLTEPDTPGDTVYTRARDYATAWLAEGVLRREPQPAMYVLEQTFNTPDGHTHTRRAFTAALELTRFDEGVVLPHERTFSGPKADRLNLTRATQAAWGHIFILYPDAQNHIHALLQPAIERMAPLAARERVIEPAVEQRFWIVTDASVQAAIVDEMAPMRSLVIADGHHRYETALNYRYEMRSQHPDAPAGAAFNYALATFVSMSDPGLVILPTHRLVRLDAPRSGAELHDALAPYFDIKAVATRAELESGMSQVSGNLPRFGFYDGRYTLLTLRSLDVMAPLAPEHTPTWRALDVAVLHKLIIEHILGLDAGGDHDADNISYLRHADAGYAAVDKGDAQLFFVLNPTRMEQVNACTRAGEKMPQKSTDFYPKMVSGLVAMGLSGLIGE